MRLILFLLVLILALASCSSGSNKGYENVSVGELGLMMEDEDVFLVDVHVPEQRHIEGTDTLVPYDEIEENLEKFPEDKKIVLYCRSGSMSTQASKRLAELGYSNVYNLIGGVNAWKAAGYPLEEE